MGTTHELLSRARRGDLDGMCVAGLARLSHEVREDSPEGRELYARMVAEVESARKGRLPFSGADIKGRDEQEKDIRRYVESHGGTYVYTYHEPDTSAWKKRRVRMPDGTVKYRVVRPVFQGMLEDLKRGQAPNGQRLDGIAVVDIDRLTRENRTLEDAIEVVEHYGRPIIDLSGQLDLLTENGRTVARLLVGAKGAESASIARRVERKHRALEQAGIPTGSRRPFGWQEDKRTLNEAEAAELRAAVERLLVGAPMRAILGEWRDRGIVTPAGKTWTYRTLKDKLRDPRICGYRSRKIKEYNPETDRETRRFEIVRDERGKPVIGQWESIISVEQWQAVTDVIGRNADPTRYTGGGFNSRKYLLVGTLRCKCGEKLRASKSGWSKTRKAEGHFTYNCPASSTGRGCGGTRIDGPDTDAWAVLAVIARYQREAAERHTEQLPQEWPGQEELNRVLEDIADHRKARRERKISAEEYFEALAQFEAEKRALIADQNKWTRAQAEAQGAPVDLAADWDGLSLAQQGRISSGR